MSDPYHVTVVIGAVEAGLIVTGIGGAITLVGQLVRSYLRDIRDSAEKDRNDRTALVEKMFALFTENSRLNTSVTRALDEHQRGMNEIYEFVRVKK